MVREIVRTAAFVVFVLTVLAAVLIAIGDGRGTVARPELPARTDVPGPDQAGLATAPRVQILPSNTTVGLDDSTKMGIVTFNPPTNDRTVNVVVHVSIRHVSDVLVRVNGRLPQLAIPRRSDGPFSSTRGWVLVRSLDPGEVSVEAVTVGSCSKPGTYEMNVDVWFIEDGRWVHQPDVAVLTVESRPGSTWLETECTVRRVSGNAVTCARDLGQCVVDNRWVVALLGVLTAILLSDRFWAILDRDRRR